MLDWRFLGCLHVFGAFVFGGGAALRTPHPPPPPPSGGEGARSPGAGWAGGERWLGARPSREGGGVPGGVGWDEEKGMGDGGWGGRHRAETARPKKRAGVCAAGRCQLAGSFPAVVASVGAVA
jgi:hypothetical protein